MGLTKAKVRVCMIIAGPSTARCGCAEMSGCLFIPRPKKGEGKFSRMNPQISFHPEQLNMDKKILFFIISVVNVLLGSTEPAQFNGDLCTGTGLAFRSLPGFLL